MEWEAFWEHAARTAAYATAQIRACAATARAVAADAPCPAIYALGKERASTRRAALVPAVFQQGVRSASGGLLLGAGEVFD